MISVLRAKINQNNRLLMAEQIPASCSYGLQRAQGRWVTSVCSVMSVLLLQQHMTRCQAQLIPKAARLQVRSVSKIWLCSMKFSFFFFLASCACCICPQSANGSKAMSDNTGDSGTLDKRGIPQRSTYCQPLLSISFSFMHAVCGCVSAQSNTSQATEVFRPQ